jgi:cytoskeletal protein RodZ
MSLEQIGQQLQQARESQSLSLRQIYEKTKIPIGHLQAIDVGDQDELPEPVYVANYIRRYGNCVGLNGEVLSDQYRKEADQVLQSAKSMRPVQPVYASPKYVEGMKLDHAPPTFKTIYFNAILIVGVVGLVSYLSMAQLNNQANQQDPSLVALRESTAKFNAQQALQSPGLATSGISANSLLPGQENPGQTRISLSANQHVWVEVKSQANGESLFTGYLEQGDQRDFQDAQGLRVRAGNGGSLTVNYLGKVESFGAAGKIAERTFGSEAPTIAQDSQTTTTTSAPTPAPVVKKPKVQKSELAARNQTERVDDLSDRHYSGYSSGHSGSGGGSDVPYRYSEGRLDSE